MAKSETKTIVVKRYKKSGGGHHGGAWKIAYADFVTAMMAFFLLMWLLGSTAKGQLDGIAEYFQSPLQIAMKGGDGSGDSSSVIQGGGTDLTRRAGQVKKGDVKTEDKTYTVRAAQAEAERQEAERLQALKGKIEALIENSPTLKQFRSQLLLDITSEGLRVQIVDELNRPMFALGKAELQPYAREILQQIGKALNDVPNRVSLAGHTDSTPYQDGVRGYGNWELSADRAAASRRELIAGGMDDNKVMRMIGLSSAVLLDKANPSNPINRRISIVVMNKKSEEAFLRDGETSKEAPAEGAAPAGQGAAVPASPATGAPAAAGAASPAGATAPGAAPAAAPSPATGAGR